MSKELVESEIAVIKSIMAGDKAWSSIDGLVKAGHRLETITDLLIKGAGETSWLETWKHRDDGDCVTLTSWGAWRWAQFKEESLELVERPATVKRDGPRRKLTLKEREKRAEDRCLTSRVVFWAEGSEASKPRRKRLVEYRAPLPELVRDPHVPEYLSDEVSGKEIELFNYLFDGTKVRGIKIKIDRRLKGKGKAKGKGGAKAQPKRRRAG